MCDQLITLGYQTAVVCDNDAPDQLSDADIQSLLHSGTHICQWDNDNSTERQLFADLPWQYIPALLETICDSHDTLEHATVVDIIINEPQIQTQNLGRDPASWPESPVLRKVLGNLANDRRWIKRMDYAEFAFTFALPLLPGTSILKSRLNNLWSWIQEN